MPLLRGHHLICLHFFHGEGYNERFIKNLIKTLRKTRDEDIEVSSGADDVCRSCPSLKQGRCQYKDEADEEIRKMDNKALELLMLTGEEKIKWKGLREKITDIFAKWYSVYCSECDWRQACERDGFFQHLKQERLK